MKREVGQQLDTAGVSAKAYGFHAVAGAIELAIDPLRRTDDVPPERQ